MRARSVNFRVDAVIVESAAFQQNLVYVGHLAARLGLGGGSQEVRVVRVAFQNTRLMAQDHLDGDIDSREKGVFELISENGGQ